MVPGVSGWHLTDTRPSRYCFSLFSPVSTGRVTEHTVVTGRHTSRIWVTLPLRRRKPVLEMLTFAGVTHMLVTFAEGSQIFISKSNPQHLLASPHVASFLAHVNSTLVAPSTLARHEKGISDRCRNIDFLVSPCEIWTACSSKPRIPGPVGLRATGGLWM
ncbi:hypothetical protein K503DRAFT_797477 [Rhizopogon vinicolor AM-OR11-026]|uniref:Uncharacterized protein n=1 Tax=Rhizopogon vinicolor AM-OR11-026 TaxID=1314800 RepID=A0A1B7NB33_9AGAM|nr:hypothetical protein K503DRAFT_797477 [Rhizopogon vinicolor AM-OR11-026]